MLDMPKANIAVNTTLTSDQIEALKEMAGKNGQSFREFATETLLARLNETGPGESGVIGVVKSEDWRCVYCNLWKPETERRVGACIACVGPA
jgi:hypothetical protein